MLTKNNIKTLEKSKDYRDKILHIVYDYDINDNFLYEIDSDETITENDLIDTRKYQYVIVQKQIENNCDITKKEFFDRIVVNNIYTDATITDFTELFYKLVDIDYNTLSYQIECIMLHF